MHTLIFVYGTLKEGFPNFPLNPGRRMPGTFRTCQPFPLYVVQLPVEDRAPWLVNHPGQGMQVSGQVFEVDDETLQSMDRFEEVGMPTGYVRLELALEPADQAGGVLRAHAYMKELHQLSECLLIEGPFPDYTAELALGYRLALP